MVEKKTEFQLQKNKDGWQNQPLPESATLANSATQYWQWGLHWPPKPLTYIQGYCQVSRARGLVGVCISQRTTSKIAPSFTPKRKRLSMLVISSTLEPKEERS
jgi:hypothetical protein